MNTQEFMDLVQVRVNIAEEKLRCDAIRERARVAMLEATNTESM